MSLGCAHSCVSTHTDDGTSDSRGVVEMLTSRVSWEEPGNTSLLSPCVLGGGAKGQKPQASTLCVSPSPAHWVWLGAKRASSEHFSTCGLRTMALCPQSANKASMSIKQVGCFCSYRTGHWPGELNIKTGRLQTAEAHCLLVPEATKSQVGSPQASPFIGAQSENLLQVSLLVSGSYQQFFDILWW